MSAALTKIPLEDLIDSCVIESIKVWRRGFKALLTITHLHQTFNAPSHPIRLLRLLAIINQEGNV